MLAQMALPCQGLCVQKVSFSMDDSPCSCVEPVEMANSSMDATIAMRRTKASAKRSPHVRACVSRKYQSRICSNGWRTP